MHERYSIPTVLFLSLLVYYESKWIKAAVAVSITTYFNLTFVMTNVLNIEPVMWMVYVNVGAFIWMMAALRNVSVKKQKSLLKSKLN